MSRHLHIVCLDAPFPPDYGGAIEIFGKIRALHQAGIKIHLHYFDYNGRDGHQMASHCETVDSYPRKSGWKSLSMKTPYIVASRINEQLVSNLGRDNHPILLEGLHCTGILERINRNGRRIVVRLHNDEACYYRRLASFESNPLKKIYYLAESRLLKKYQATLPRDCLYATLSKKDASRFHDQLQLKTRFLPAFTSWSEVSGKEGIGNFCLYHGNLAIPENEKAACWLIDKVFRKIKVPFVIAGKHPSRRLRKWAHLYQHTCLVADPSEKEMNDLVQKAHINIIPSFNETGIKLKLLHALYSGRHCVVNPCAVQGSELEAACHVGKNANAIASIVLQLYHQPFGEEEIRLRKEILCENYSNEKNAQRLIAWLY